MKTLEDLKAELHELVNSFGYAYAMGHGCTIGDHPQFQATRQRAADLRALISEYEVSDTDKEPLKKPGRSQRRQCPHCKGAGHQRLQGGGIAKCWACIGTGLK